MKFNLKGILLVFLFSSFSHCIYKKISEKIFVIIYVLLIKKFCVCTLYPWLETCFLLYISTISINCVICQLLRQQLFFFGARLLKSFSTIVQKDTKGSFKACPATRSIAWFKIQLLSQKFGFQYLLCPTFCDHFQF